MTSYFSDTNLIASLDYCEQCQNCKLNSWINKNLQMTLQDSCLNEIDIQLLDPLIKQKYLQLKELIIFKTKYAELEFYRIFLSWNQLFLKNLQPDNINYQIPSPIEKPQIELPVSKDHQFDNQTETYQKSQSITEIYEDILDFNQSQKISQTQFQLDEYFPNTNMITQQTQTYNNNIINEDQQINEFLNSKLYKTLKSKQFLIDAQLISIIQTILLYNKNNQIQINDQIQNEIEDIQRRIKQEDQVSQNIINILIDMLD